MNAAAREIERPSIDSCARMTQRIEASDALEPGLSARDAERPLRGFLREQAAELLDWTVNAELEEFLGRFSTMVDPFGRPAVVRNGYQPARELITNLDPVRIRVPKVRSRIDRSTVFRSTVFRSALARP